MMPITLPETVMPGGSPAKGMLVPEVCSGTEAFAQVIADVLANAVNAVLATQATNGNQEGDSLHLAALLKPIQTEGEVTEEATVTGGNEENGEGEEDGHENASLSIASLEGLPHAPVQVEVTAQAVPFPAVPLAPAVVQAPRDVAVGESAGDALPRLDASQVSVIGDTKTVMADIGSSPSTDEGLAPLSGTAPQSTVPADEQAISGTTEQQAPEGAFSGKAPAEPAVDATTLGGRRGEATAEPDAAVFAGATGEPESDGAAARSALPAGAGLGLRVAELASRPTVMETVAPAMLEADDLLRATGADGEPIVPRFVAGNAQEGEFVATLEPKDLGQLGVRVVLREGALRVSLAAERPEAAQLIQHHLPELRHSLEEQGLRLAGLGLERGDLAWTLLGDSRQQRYRGEQLSGGPLRVEEVDDSEQVSTVGRAREIGTTAARHGLDVRV